MQLNMTSHLPKKGCSNPFPKPLGPRSFVTASWLDYNEPLPFGCCIDDVGIYNL